MKKLTTAKSYELADIFTAELNKYVPLAPDMKLPQDLSTLDKITKFFRLLFTDEDCGMRPLKVIEKLGVQRDEYYLWKRSFKDLMELTRLRFKERAEDLIDDSFDEAPYLLAQGKTQLPIFLMKTEGGLHEKVEIKHEQKININLELAPGMHRMEGPLVVLNEDEYQGPEVLDNIKDE